MLSSEPSVNRNPLASRGFCLQFVKNSVSAKHNKAKGNKIRYDSKSQYSKMVKCIGSGGRLLGFLILIMPFTSNETLSNLNLAVPQFSHL